MSGEKPEDRIMDLDCDELERTIEFFEEVNNRCIGNLSPIDSIQVAAPEDQEIESYLRHKESIANKEEFEAFMLPGDSELDIESGDLKLYIHTVYKETPDAGGESKLFYEVDSVEVHLLKPSIDSTSLTVTGTRVVNEG